MPIPRATRSLASAAAAAAYDGRAPGLDPQNTQIRRGILITIAQPGFYVGQAGSLRPIVNRPSGGGAGLTDVSVPCKRRKGGLTTRRRLAACPTKSAATDTAAPARARYARRGALESASPPRPPPSAAEPRRQR